MGLSVYVHVPFCRRRCFYCAFYSGEDLGLLPRYPERICKEVSLRRLAATPTPPSAASSVYFGGGTPSLLAAAAVRLILDSIAGIWGLCPGAEVTIEANPGDTLNFRDLFTAGVTRVSVGVQSLDDTVLRHLGRRHTADDALRALSSASTAGLRTSADLIFGLTGLDSGTFPSTVEQLRSAGAEHVSTYSIEVHAGTPFAADLADGHSPEAEPAEEDAQWTALDAALRSNGLLPYELSNYCLPGAASRHNLNYWEGGPYIGLGPGAHSYDPADGSWGTRAWNDPDLLSYTDAVDSDRLPPGGSERLTHADALLESLFLALRRPVALDFDELSDRFGLDTLPTRATLDQAAREGLLIPFPERPGVYTPSARGIRAADGLTLWLMDALDLAHPTQALQTEDQSSLCSEQGHDSPSRWHGPAGEGD